MGERAWAVLAERLERARAGRGLLGPRGKERVWGEREWAGRARLGRVGGGVTARAPWSWAVVLGAVRGGGDSRATRLSERGVGWATA